MLFTVIVWRMSVVVVLCGVRCLCRVMCGDACLVVCVVSGVVYVD